MFCRLLQCLLLFEPFCVLSVLCRTSNGKSLQMLRFPCHCRLSLLYFVVSRACSFVFPFDRLDGKSLLMTRATLPILCVAAEKWDVEGRGVLASNVIQDFQPCDEELVCAAQKMIPFYTGVVGAVKPSSCRLVVRALCGEGDFMQKKSA